MIFRCHQHRAWVCQIHAAFCIVFRTVLDSHRDHLFFSSLHLVIFDDDRLRY